MNASRHFCIRSPAALPGPAGTLASRSTCLRSPPSLTPPKVSIAFRCCSCMVNDGVAGDVVTIDQGALITEGDHQLKLLAEDG